MQSPQKLCPQRVRIGFERTSWQIGHRKSLPSGGSKCSNLIRFSTSSVVSSELEGSSEAICIFLRFVVVDSVEGVIQTVITNYVNQPVSAITAVASNLNDQFSNYILKPALAGDSVPGLFPVSSVAGSGIPSSTKTQGGKTPVASGASAGAKDTATPTAPATSVAPTTPATPVLTPAGQRRQLGQLFQSKYQDYIGMLDTVHTPMQKI